ncbi:MAG: hypothetical protein ACR2OH_04100 [Microthrixaceae bacterium]
MATTAVGADRILAAMAFAITLLLPATPLTSTFTGPEPAALLCVAAPLRALVA